MASKQPQVKKRSSKLGLLTALYSVIIVGFIVGAAGLGYVYYLVRDVPPLTLDTVKTSETSFVLDIQGRTIAQLHATQNRVSVPLSSMPKHLVEGVVVMEDVRFYDHFGFSPRDFVRGLYLTLTGQSRQGASTITQQVARNRILNNLSFSIKRKVQEIYVAFRIEKEFTKDEILEAYLNEIFLGGSANGFQAASLQYFGKNVKDLNLAESAILVGLIPSPNAWRPRPNDMDAANSRQKVVLEQMLKHKLITEQQMNDALKTPITLATQRNQSADTNLTMYFVDHVIRQVEDVLMKQNDWSRNQASSHIHNAGLKIHTTLDLDLQKAGEKGAMEIFTQSGGILDRLRRVAQNDPNPEIRELAKKDGFTWVNTHGLQPQVSMLIMEPNTGHIKAWLGGRDIIGRHGRDRVAKEKNQPGSAIKPVLVYGPALASGQFTGASTIDDAPVAYPTGNPDNPLYVPRNFDVNVYWGHTSIRTGIARSYNVMSVKLLNTIGVRNAIAWAEKLGLSFVKSGPANDVGLASGLGGLTEGLSLHELVRAYNVFNNKGVLVEPTSLLRVTSKEGSIMYQAPAPKQEIVASEQLAWLMTELMRGTVESRDGVTGTGSFGLRNAAMGRYLGEASGKTGTTTQNNDALFVGYTPHFTGGVWIGHDENSTGSIAYDNNGVALRRANSKPTQPAQQGETLQQAMLRILESDTFVRGGMPSTGDNAVGSGFATAIFGRTLSNYYTAIGNANLPKFDAEWYEEHGVFGPPKRLGMVYAPFSAVSGKYPSALCPQSEIRYDWFIRGTEPKPENSCDMHIRVRICTEHNDLATQYCPSYTVVEQVRIKRDPYAEVTDKNGTVLKPRDWERQVPFGYCSVHTPTTGGSGNGNGTGGNGGPPGGP